MAKKSKTKNTQKIIRQIVNKSGRASFGTRRSLHQKNSYYLVNQPENRYSRVSRRYQVVSDPVRSELPQKSRNWAMLQNLYKNPQLMERSLLCARRKNRREVIHALGIAGSITARPKFTQKSKITC